MSSTTVVQPDGTVTSFKDWVKADGSTEFRPEAGRYHLYVQYLCPFANRAMIGRTMKGLECVISMDNLDWELDNGELGWKFNSEREGCDADSITGATYLRELYDASAKKLGATGFKGKTTVPTLYDRKLGRVVSTESADILRMLNSEFNEFCPTQHHKDLDLYPAAKQKEIEEAEGWTTKGIVFGVYGHLFATNQQTYNAAIENLFGAMNKLEDHLSKHRYLVGNTFTEADIRLFSTLIRFDAVYIQHLCAKKRVVDYPNIWGYVREMYQMPDIKRTVHFDHILNGYFTGYTFAKISPFKIIPAMPDIDYDAPSERVNM